MRHVPPLKLTPLSRDLDDPAYALSWYEEDADRTPTTIPYASALRRSALR